MGPAVNLILNALQRYDQTVVAACAIGGEYLDRHQIMRDHYGVIDRISREGEEALSPVARERLRQEFALDDYQLLGAHQFLSRYPYFTASAVAVMYDNLQNHKLAGGTHCVEVTIRGRKTLLFNGFHPEQLDRYIVPGSSIFAIVCRTSAKWSSLRQDLTGATNPARAKEGSIRALLLRNAATIGLPEVSSGKNGVHVSAGPVEAMVEIRRFCSDLDRGQAVHLRDTTFGSVLARDDQQGRLEFYASNPSTVAAAGVQPLFDVTEEMDAWTALASLPNMEFQENDRMDS
jgi:hypothetical protein